jgi:DNA-binding response OmpR family regulator
MSKILLVEDDQLLVRLYTKKFGKEGYEVVVANNGDKGIAKAQSELPDIIMLDLMMPKTNGFEVLEVLSGSAQLKNIPVIVLTNVSSDQDEQRARELGAIDYLVKANVSPAQVVDRIQELLGEVK